MNDETQERENFCYLLGLNPFREDRYSQNDITRAINARRSKWESIVKANRSGSRNVFQARGWAALVPEMRSTMDNQVFRRNEFENARKLLSAKACRLRRQSVILADGSTVVIPSALTRLTSSINWENVDESTVIEASGIDNGAQPKIVDPNIGNAFDALETIGIWHPYGFVNALIAVPALAINAEKLENESPYGEFRTSFQTVYQRIIKLAPGKMPDQDAFIKTGRSLNMLQTDEQVGELISYCNCRHALVKATEAMDNDSGQPFDHAYIDSILRTYVTGKGLDPVLSTAILEDYCIRKGYPADFCGKDSSLMHCPSCGALIERSDELFFCPVCGAILRTVCPVCGRVQSASDRICSGCGKTITESRAEAERTDGTVRRYISAGETAKAKKEMAMLKDKFPKYGQIAELEDIVLSTDRRLGDIKKKVSEDNLSRNLYDLKVCVDDALREFPDLLSDESIRARYEEACTKVSEADRLCVKATSGKEGSEDLYIRASEICPDHPDALAQLKTRPPEGPADGFVETRIESVVVRYSVPRDRRGMTFCVYRSTGSYPAVDASTKPLSESDRGVFEDTTLDPGKIYYYRVYSKRWGVLSRDFAECGPVMITREVTNVSISQLEDGLAIRYMAPTGCTRVRVWRKEGSAPVGEGEEIELIKIEKNHFEDHGLRGRQSYSYLFVTEYDFDGNTLRSLGTVFSGETCSYPDPVDDMVIKWNKEEDTYTAKWSRRERVDLYCSNKRTQLSSATVPLADLDKWMTKIVPLSTKAGECTFRLDPGAALYVFPIIPVGETGVKGTESLVANLRPFRDLHKRMDNTDCLITVTWPEGAEKAVVIIGATKDDPEDQKVEVTREDYDKKGGIRIPIGNVSHRTISMYAVYHIENDFLRSIGVTTDIWNGTYQKVRYSLDPVKKNKDTMRIHVKIECPGEVSMPKCVMVLSAEGIPLKKGDGEVCWESPDPVVLKNGTAEADFTVGKDKGALSKMRLFFSNGNDYNRFRFVHPLRKD